MSTSESENSEESEYDPEEEARNKHNQNSNKARKRKRAATRKKPLSDYKESHNAARARKRAATRKQKQTQKQKQALKQQRDRTAEEEKWLDPNWTVEELNELPPQWFLEKFEQDPRAAQMVFRLMAGIPEDTRRAPKPNMPSTDQAGILSEYIAATGHDVAIKVCGPCGKRAPMNDKEFRMLPFTHKTLQLTRADKKKLPAKNSVPWKAKHLVQHKNHFYHLAQEGVANGKVIVCTSCDTAAQGKKKPPIQFFAHYDVGIIPSYLPKLSYAEKLAISKVMVFSSTLQYKKIQGSGCTGVKGHVFALRMDREDVRKSIVNCLPRADLGKRIQLAIHGQKDTHRAVQTALRNSELRLRLDAMLLWLVWLKKVGHPDYQDVNLPESEETKAVYRAQLEASVDEIIENASYSESRTVEYLSEITRAAVSDDRDGLNNEMTGTETRTVFLADEAGTDAPMKHVFREIAEKMKASAEEAEEEIESECQVKRTVKGKAVNDYSANHELLSGAFPFLFPFGITAEDITKKTLPKQLTRCWLELYDARFAQDKILLFLIWDHLKRHNVNNKVSFVVKRGGQRVDDFTDLVNAEGFYERVLHANAAPDSKEARQLQESMAPMIKICGRTVPWSTQEKNDALGKIYSLMHFFSIASHWITISPAMRENRLALRLAVESNGTEWTLPDIELRSKLIAENPVVATRIFYRLLHKFFEILVQCDLTDMTDKRGNVEALFARLRGEKVGIFGSINAAFGVLEEQGSGNLHFHGVLFGGWSIEHFKLHIHKSEVQRELVEMIDAQINCEISDEIKEQHQDETVPKEHIVFASEPYPSADQVKPRAQRQAARLNHHQHTTTCWRPNNPHCRMDFKRSKSDKTCPCQIIQDDTTDAVKAVRKYPEPDAESVERIDEPPAQTPGNPFANPDTRVVGFSLKRVDEFEQNQVEQNDMCTVCLQCNTCIAPLVTGSQGKAAKYYICKYCAKQPYKLLRTLALIQQALEEIKKYGSTAEDAGTALRQTKHLLEKLLNKTNIAEVSGQQAAARGLFFDAYLCTHRLNKFVSPWEAVRTHRERYGEEVSEENVDVESHRLEFSTDTGRAVTTSPWEMYRHRGEALRKLSNYDYCAIIGVKQLPKASADDEKDEEKEYSGRGRPRNATFQFAPGTAAAKCKVQTIMSCPCIPRIAGPPPPAYPGNPPCDEDDALAWRVWNENARTFVEFYTLLFVPLDAETLCPIVEHDRGILPWQGRESWQRFWQMMEDWNADPGDNSWQKCFDRSTWRIVRNMIDNLRLKPKERRLVKSWRTRSADPKPMGADAAAKATANWRGGGDEDHDDYHILIEYLRAKYGADLTRQQKERRKVMDYVERQLSTLRELEPAVFAPESAMKTRSFPNYSVADCEQLKAKHAAQENERVHESNRHAQNNEAEPKLHAYQHAAVEKMRRCYEDDDQMLVFLQGQNGSGKTFVAQHLSKILGLDIRFSATTNQAAALLDAGTINSLLVVHLNEETQSGRFKEPSAATIQRIIDAMRDKDGLLIDECSMLSPSLLALIEFKLRQSLNPNRPFGGKHVILVGDMVQFKPVGRKYGLYEAILRYTKGQYLSRNCKTGAQLFAQFTMVKLEGQARASEAYYKWISALRDLKKMHPVTDDWLAQLPILTKDDLTDPEWEFAPIAVTGHAERRAINEHQAKRFAKKHREPILRWTCPMKRGKGGATHWQTVDEDVEGTHDELVRYFVRGAPCILNERYDTESGITKGSVGYFDGVVWEDPEQAEDLDSLSPGEVHTVAQPEYVLVRFPATKRRPETVIALRRMQLTFKNPQNSKLLLTCLGHGCDLRFACTYHSLQGATMDRLILSLGAIESTTRKIADLSLTSLLVGTSRVRGFGSIRAISADLQQLKSLKQIPYLTEYFANYDANGKWKMSGLKEELQAIQQATDKKMALVPLEAWSKKELQQFIKIFDLAVDKTGASGGAVRADLIRTIQLRHAEQREELLANGGELLKQEQARWEAHVRNEGWRSFDMEELRTMAKCMGVKSSDYRTDKKLKSTMTSLFDHKRKAGIALSSPSKRRRCSDKREMDASDDDDDI